jgi:hypothetical protein
VYLAIHLSAFFDDRMQCCPECSQRLHACKRRCGKAFTSDCKSIRLVVLHKYFYQTGMATESYRALPADGIIKDSDPVSRHVVLVGSVSESLKMWSTRPSPWYHKLHHDGRFTTNRMQSGCCLKICMLIRKDWSDKRGTCQRDRPRGPVLGSGSAEEGEQGPRYERRKWTCMGVSAKQLQQGKSCWRASPVHSML